MHDHAHPRRPLLDQQTTSTNTSSDVTQSHRWLSIYADVHKKTVHSLMISFLARVDGLAASSMHGLVSLYWHRERTCGNPAATAPSFFFSVSWIESGGYYIENTARKKKRERNKRGTKRFGGKLLFFLLLSLDKETGPYGIRDPAAAPSFFPPLIPAKSYLIPSSVSPIYRSLYRYQ